MTADSKCTRWRLLLTLALGIGLVAAVSCGSDDRRTDTDRSVVVSGADEQSRIYEYLEEAPQGAVPFIEDEGRAILGWLPVQPPADRYEPDLLHSYISPSESGKLLLTQWFYLGKGRERVLLLQGPATEVHEPATPSSLEATVGGFRVRFWEVSGGLVAAFATEANSQDGDSIEAVVFLPGTSRTELDAFIASLGPGPS